MEDPDDLDDVALFLFRQGVYATLAAYPLVPRSDVGFRIQLTAAHTDDDIAHLITALGAPVDRFALRQWPPHDRHGRDPAGGDPAERRRRLARLARERYIAENYPSCTRPTPRSSITTAPSTGTWRRTASVSPWSSAPAPTCTR